MPNSLATLFAALLAVLLLFIYPTLDAYSRQDDISYSLALQSVTKFVDSVRDKGYVTPQMYDDFTQQLSLTNNLYDIELQHFRKNFDPKYIDPANQGTFQDDFAVNYYGFYTEDILAKLFPNNTEPIDSAARRYQMEIGDFFYVKVTNTNETHSSLLSSFLGMGKRHPNIIIPYGGMVLNETY